MRVEWLKLSSSRGVNSSDAISGVGHHCFGCGTGPPHTGSHLSANLRGSQGEGCTNASMGRVGPRRSGSAASLLPLTAYPPPSPSPPSLAMRVIVGLPRRKQYVYMHVSMCV